MKREEPVFLLEGVEKSYGAVAALRGLDLSVGRGRICGLIGPDGAGKTTAMRILCGLLRPDAGRARVLGRDCAADGARARERLGYMPQRFSLYPDLTVAENIRFFADLFGVPPAERRAREEELTAFSRLGPFRRRRAGRLSGGMKQKLALSVTLIHRPEALILDEPTTGVDPVSRKEFWRILRDLAGEGLALLVSTPYMDEAELCDEVILMHRGGAIGRGKPEELAARFPRRILEIAGADLAGAAERLARGLPEGTAIRRFGDRIHLVYVEDREAEEALRLLEGLAVVAERAEPSMEDLFLEWMERDSSGAWAPS